MIISDAGAYSAYLRRKKLVYEEGNAPFVVILGTRGESEGGGDLYLLHCTALCLALGREIRLGIPSLAGSFGKCLHVGVYKFSAHLPTRRERKEGNGIQRKKRFLVAPCHTIFFSHQ